MKIKINGESFVIETTTIETTTTEPSTSVTVSTEIILSELLNAYKAKPPYAVAVNGEFVAQDLYEKTTVTSSDLVDVVSPIFGG